MIVKHIALVKLSTLVVVLGVMGLSVAVLANEADGAGIVWRAINKAGSLVSDLADVASGCTDGQVLKFQTSNSTWICGSDNGFTTITHISSSGDASLIYSNSSSKTVLKKLSGTSNNVTISGNSTGTLTYNLGSNVVTTGQSRQTVTKGITFQNDIQSQINGLDLNYTRKTSGSYTAVGQDVTIIMTAGAANNTLTLPSASTVTGQVYNIVRNDTSPARTNRLIIDASGSETIDNSLMYNLTRNLQSVAIQSDGSKWTVIEESGKPVSIFGTNLVKGSNFNRWYGSAMTQGTTTTTTQRANTMTATPFPVSVATTFDQIQIDVTTTKAASTCRAAIYTDNGNGYPDKLVSGSDVGTILTSGAGRAGNTFSGPITLQSGMYWLGFQCSGGGQGLRAWTNTQIYPALGYVSTSTASSTTTGYNSTFTYAAFPNNWPVSTVTTTTHSPAMVLLRPVG